MKWYKYKIQWLIKNNIKELKKLLSIFGVENIDKIVFRDYDLNVISVVYPKYFSKEKTYKELTENSKNPKADSIEILRR